MDQVNNLLGKMTGWIDSLFSDFWWYSQKYSKWIMYAVLLVAASKVFHIRMNLGGGKR